MKSYKTIINEIKRESNYVLVKNIYNKFPNKIKKEISKIEKKFDDARWDNDQRSIVAHQHGELSPLEHTIIDDAQMIVNQSLKKYNMIEFGNEYDDYTTMMKTDFIMYLWKLV